MSEASAGHGQSRPRLVYVHNPTRADKLLPLLGAMSQVELIVVRRWRDVVRVCQDVRPPAGVIIDQFGRSAVIACLIRALTGAPLITRLRGDVFREKRERLLRTPTLVSWIRERCALVVAATTLRRCDAVIANSRYLRHRVSNQLGTHKRVFVVNNPSVPPSGVVAPAQEWPGPPGALRILSVANLNHASKALPLARAITEWMESSTWRELDASWVVCGGGRLFPELQRLVAGSAAASRVALLGTVRSVDGLYRGADVFVHITELDAFPNTPVEAMLRGLPVIANDMACGTLEQVVNGSNGFVVSSALEFRDRLRLLATSPDLRARLGQAGERLAARRWTPPVQARRLWRALRRLRVVSAEQRPQSPGIRDGARSSER